MGNVANGICNLAICKWGPWPFGPTCTVVQLQYSSTVTEVKTRMSPDIQVCNTPLGSRAFHHHFTSRTRNVASGICNLAVCWSSHSANWSSILPVVSWTGEKKEKWIWISLSLFSWQMQHSDWKCLTLPFVLSSPSIKSLIATTAVVSTDITNNHHLSRSIGRLGSHLSTTSVGD